MAALQQFIVLPVLWMTSLFSYNEPSGRMSLPQQRRARANAPAAWYRLHPVIYDCGRQD